MKFRSSIPAALLLLAASACTFKPDYSSYEQCDANQRCSAGKECFVEENVCITLCGEQHPCGAEDAGADAGVVDAGESDAGDAGGLEDAGTDAGELDAGPDDGGGLFVEATIPPAVEQTAYQHTIEVDGGVPPYSFTFLSGMLPKGISFTLGTLSGTPDDAGTSTFSIQVADSDGGSAPVQRTYTLDVVPRLRVASPANLPLTDGKAYEEPLLATGGSGQTLTWSLVSGTLPANLVIQGDKLTSNGANVNAASGGSTFTLQATDPGAPGQTATRAFTLGKVGNTLTFYVQTQGIPDGRVGKPYSYKLKAGAGTPSYSWSVVSGQLPPSLSITGDTISGTPTTRGTFTCDIKADDSNQIVHGSGTITVTATIY